VPFLCVEKTTRGHGFETNHRGIMPRGHHRVLLMSTCNCLFFMFFILYLACSTPNLVGTKDDDTPATATGQDALGELIDIAPSASQANGEVTLTTSPLLTAKAATSHLDQQGLMGCVALLQNAGLSIQVAANLSLLGCHRAQGVVRHATDQALPSSAIPSNTLPPGAIPSNALPSSLAPGAAIPSNALPSSLLVYGIPSNALPSSAIPANASVDFYLLRPRDLDLKAQLETHVILSLLAVIETSTLTSIQHCGGDLAPDDATSFYLHCDLDSFPLRGQEVVFILLAVPESAFSSLRVDDKPFAELPAVARLRTPTTPIAPPPSQGSDPSNDPSPPIPPALLPEDPNDQHTDLSPDSSDPPEDPFTPLHDPCPPYQLPTGGGTCDFGLVGWYLYPEQIPDGQGTKESLDFTNKVAQRGGFPIAMRQGQKVVETVSAKKPDHGQTGLYLDHLHYLEIPFELLNWEEGAVSFFIHPLDVGEAMESMEPNCPLAIPLRHLFSANDYFWARTNNQGKIEWFGGNNTRLEQPLRSSPPLTNHVWTHLAFTWSTTSGAAIWINGACNALDSGLLPLQPENAGNGICGLPHQDPLVWGKPGCIDTPTAPVSAHYSDLKLYSRLPTAEEICLNAQRYWNGATCNSPLE